MTTRKTFISIFTLCIALLFTACGTQDSAKTANTKDSVTKAGTEASDNSNTRLNDLYQQENQLFAKHEAVWNKAFGMMNKSTVYQILPRPAHLRDSLPVLHTLQ